MDVQYVQFRRYIHLGVGSLSTTHYYFLMCLKTLTLDVYDLLNRLATSHSFVFIST